MSSALGRAVQAVRDEHRSAMRRAGEAGAGRGGRVEEQGGGGGRVGCGIPQRLHNDASVFPAQSHTSPYNIQHSQARTACLWR